MRTLMDGHMAPIGVTPPVVPLRANGAATREATDEMKPKEYTVDLGQAICRRIAAGESLPKLCKAKGMPALPDLMSWLFLEEIESFTERYLAARSARLELMMDETVTIADALAEPEKTSDNTADKIPERDRLAIAKLRIDTRKWIVDKQLATHPGDDTDRPGRLVPSEILRDGVSEA